MLLSPFAAYLSALADRALWLLTGSPATPPSFDNLLDELYSHWPLDADELPADDAYHLRAA
jgi:hypothetical protein